MCGRKQKQLADKKPREDAPANIDTNRIRRMTNLTSHTKYREPSSNVKNHIDTKARTSPQHSLLPAQFRDKTNRIP